MAQSTYSLDFDGSSGYVDFGDVLDMGTADRSVSLWFKVRSSDGDFSLIAKSFYGGADGRWWLTEDAGLSAGFQGSGAGTVTANWNHGGSILDGNWHHAAVVWDRDGLMTLYVDGVSRATADISGADGHDMQTGFHLLLGRYNDNVDGTGPKSGILALDGLIDDVAIFNAALTSGDVAGLADGSTDPATLSPVGLWRLEEASGTSTADSSGGGHDGTLTGGVSWSSDVPAALAGGGGTTESAAGSSSGSATVSGVGAAIAAGAGSSSGAGSASGVGSAVAAGAGSSAGSASAAAAGASTAAGSGSASGDGAAAGVGASTAAGAGSASGSASCEGAAAGAQAGDGSAGGSCTVSGVGAAIAAGAGSASGDGSAAAVGRAIWPAAGSASGSGSCSGVGSALFAGAGLASGVASAAGAGAAFAAAAGLAGGSCVVLAVSPGVAPTSPGLEYTLPVGRLHYALPVGRLHYTLPEED